MATNKRVVVEGSSRVTASQLQDFFRQVADGSVNGMNLQRFLDHQDPWSLDGVDINWAQVYRALGIKCHPNDFIDVPHDPNFWDVYVLAGVMPNKIVEVLRGLGVDMNLYINDLDADVTNTKRDQKNGSYRVRFQRTVEADPDLAEKSAEDLDGQGVDGITLVERLLLELGFFLATGNHLDVENITLCAGSRDSDGRVPSVCWGTDDRKVYVSWDRPGYGHSSLRTRAAVSVPALALPA